MNDIKHGMRVLAIDLPDEHCDHHILWGVGTVVKVGPRIVVRFDDGNGGAFDESSLYPEPTTWVATARHLRLMDWNVDYVDTSDLPPFLWIAPDGTSHADFRSNSADAPPEVVMSYAMAKNQIHFTHLSAT